MMKRLVFLIALLAVSVLSTRSQTPDAHAGQDHTRTQSENCNQMMADHAAEIRATSQTLATNLAQMKAMLPLINDLNERNRWQANIAMWQAVADHFSRMAEHTAHLQAMEMGCAMMGRGSNDEGISRAKAR